MTDDDLFSLEEETIQHAKNLLAQGEKAFTKEEYAKLLNRYEKLFVQMRRILKMSDRFQRELALAKQELERVSVIDALTKIPNRRDFNHTYEKEWKRSRRDTSSLAIGMIDIDYFKRFNDTYGHISGDDCLQRVAAALQSALHRPSDYLARYGGEEFSVILPDTDSQGALQVAEAMRANVERLGIAHAASHLGVVTISMGLSVQTCGQDEQAMFVPLNCSDKALYRAKEDGRNRVVVFDA